MLSESLLILRQGALELQCAAASVRSEMLSTLAAAVRQRVPDLLMANQIDCAEHKDSLSESLYQRLKLSAEKLATLCQGIEELSQHEDPLGRVQLRTELDQGLVLERINIPIGVFAVIFESRPDVFLQVLSLALRSGNGVVLKGGREATHTHRAMLKVVQEAFGADSRFSSRWFLLIEGREATEELLKHDRYIDLVIPRGSNEFVRYIQERSKIPVLGHASGVCHLYVHPSADFTMSIAVIVDAKVQYPAACNAVETVLIDKAIAAEFLPRLYGALVAAGVQVRGCAAVAKVLPEVERVGDAEWSTEYGDRVIALKVVDGIAAAIAHINHHGSHHTDGILAAEAEACESFIRGVDSADVFCNCSTRFADGFRFGFGAEVGIGTGKLHARGPVGIEGLLTYKYVLRGNGHTVASYSDGGGSTFRFKRLPV